LDAGRAGGARRVLVAAGEERVAHAEHVGDVDAEDVTVFADLATSSSSRAKRQTRSVE